MTHEKQFKITMPPLCVRSRVAMEALSIGKTRFYELLHQGKLTRPPHLPTHVVWDSVLRVAGVEKIHAEQMKLKF